MDSSYNSPTTKPLFKGIQIVWYIIAVLEVMLVFRFILKLAGARPEAQFTNFIYNTTWPIVAPFASVFSQTTVQGSIFEWTTLLAMAVYFIIGLAIAKLFLMSKTVSTPEAAANLEE